MAESLDTWEHVAWDGSHTWGEDAQEGTYPVADDDSALHKAAYTGDIARLALSLTGIDNVDARNCYGCTPLHLATRGNRAEAVLVLLSAGADHQLEDEVESCYMVRLAVIDSAAYFGSNDVLIALANYGLEIPASALRRAAQCNQVDCIRTILEKVKSDEFSEKPLLAEARIALHIAAASHHRETVDLLLTHVPGFPDANLEADKDALTHAMLGLLSDFDYDQGCRRVYPAIGPSTLPILNQLVTAGAEVDSRAFWASVNDPVPRDVVRFLLDHGLRVNDTRNWDQFLCYKHLHESQSMLFIIAGDTMDNTSLLKEFLAKGASATTTDHNLDTPLHHAAHCSFTEVLLEHGADINATNRQGHSPLYTACKHNRLDVAKLLLSRGADVNAIVRDEHWLSLMFLVIETYWHDCGGALSPRLQLADLLLGHGADVHAATKDGTTVLHKAVQFIDAALVRHLVERGADVHATTAAGQSILHTLCWNYMTPWISDCSVIAFLLNDLVDLGVDPNARDGNGATPLHGLMGDHDHASWKPDLVNALLERGADMDLKNNDGKSPAELLDMSKWFSDDAGLLRATPVLSQSHVPGTQGRGRGGRGRGRLYPSTWT